MVDSVPCIKVSTASPLLEDNQKWYKVIGSAERNRAPAFEITKPEAKDFAHLPAIDGARILDELKPLDLAPVEVYLAALNWLMGKVHLMLGLAEVVHELQVDEYEAEMLSYRRFAKPVGQLLKSSTKLICSKCWLI